MPRVWYLPTRARLTWWCALLRKTGDPAVGPVQAMLGFPPAPAARRPARLRPLPSTQCCAMRCRRHLGLGYSQQPEPFTYRLVMRIRIGVLSAAVDGQGIYTHVHAADGLSFSSGAALWAVSNRRCWRTSGRFGFLMVTS